MFSLGVSCFLLGPLLMSGLAGGLRVFKQVNHSRLLNTLTRLSQFWLFMLSGLILTKVWAHGKLNFNLFSSFQAENSDYALQILIEPYTACFLLLVSFICGVIAHFSSNYLAHEAGYYKFFMNFYLMQLALYTLILSSNLYFILISWELLGLTSIFLIAFYQTCHKTVENALFVLSIYKFCDFFLILALLILHHEQQSFLLHASQQPGSWAFALALLIATMGKSALFPFSKWVPRAMEGPTTSSAIFYGALSVHAGIILLIKCRFFFSQHPELKLLILILGLLTAVYASLKSRIQTDAKATLAYATVAQVGLSYMAFACGWYTLVVAHVISNALLKTYQFIRSPSQLLHLQELEELNSRHFFPHGQHFDYLLKKSQQAFLYRLVYHNFGLSLAWKILLTPLFAAFRRGNQIFESGILQLSRWPLFRYQSVVLSLACLALLGLLQLEQISSLQPVPLTAVLLSLALMIASFSLIHTTIKQYLVKIKLSYFLVSASAVLFFGSLSHIASVAYFTLNLISLLILSYFIRYLSRRLDLDSLRSYLGLGHRYTYISMIALTILLMLTFTPGFASFLVFDVVLEDLAERSRLITLLFLGVNLLNSYACFKFMFKLLYGETQQHLNEYPDFTPLERLKLATLILPMLAAGLWPFFI